MKNTVSLILSGRPERMSVPHGNKKSSSKSLPYEEIVYDFRYSGHRLEYWQTPSVSEFLLIFLARAREAKIC